MQENEPLSQTGLGLYPGAGPHREQAEDLHMPSKEWLSWQ